jgi:hypothetical protein
MRIVIITAAAAICVLCFPSISSAQDCIRWSIVPSFTYQYHETDVDKINLSESSGSYSWEGGYTGEEIKLLNDNWDYHNYMFRFGVSAGADFGSGLSAQVGAGMWFNTMDHYSLNEKRADYSMYGHSPGMYVSAGASWFVPVYAGVEAGLRPSAMYGFMNDMQANDPDGDDPSLQNYTMSQSVFEYGCELLIRYPVSSFVPYTGLSWQNFNQKIRINERAADEETGIMMYYRREIFLKPMSQFAGVAGVSYKMTSASCVEVRSVIGKSFQIALNFGVGL